jgi:outer membrane beta-barrel protein
MKRILTLIWVIGICLSIPRALYAANVIEKQLEDIGSIPNEEIIVVQRKYTRKNWRFELTPVTFGGIPFGTVRNSLFGGASLTLHANDWLGLELFNFEYSKTFFSSFASDINNNIAPGSTQAPIEPSYQKLLYFLTTGLQFTPFYGKGATFSHYIAYLEPYFALGAGIAVTESNLYVTYYPAVGIRAFFREWLSMKVELRDYMYTENTTTLTAGATTSSAFRNNWAVMVSLSFWLPKMPR